MASPNVLLPLVAAATCSANWRSFFEILEAEFGHGEHGGFRAAANPLSRIRLPLIRIRAKYVPDGSYRSKFAYCVFCHEFSVVWDFFTK